MMDHKYHVLSLYSNADITKSSSVNKHCHSHKSKYQRAAWPRSRAEETKTVVLYEVRAMREWE